MTAAEHDVVIVGSGAAGHSCARALRAEGFAGRIRLVNGEGGLPVNRTLVDKGVLPGLLTGAQIALPPLADVEVVAGRAVGLDAFDRRVALEDGRALQGDAIVLASGSEPRALDARIRVDAGVQQHVLHGVEDAERLRQAVPEPVGASVVVLGAGFIGAEVANHFAGAGARVTLIGRSALPLRAAVGEAIATRLAELQAAHVDARLGVGVVAVRRAAADRPDAVVVELDDGASVEGDVLVVAVGYRAATAWAGFDGAVPVDDRFRVVGQPGLYAAGGASAPALAHGRVRVDHWDAATAQGAHAAKAVLHDLGLTDDPGSWRATTGFTLMVHGAVVAARGVRLADASESTAELEGGGLLTDFSSAAGTLTGVAGWKAGASLVRAAARL